MLAAYALVLTVSWQLSTGRLRVGGIQLTADDLKMKDPVYFGVTKEGGRYQVRAKRAVVSLNQNAPIKLIDVSGELTEANKVVTKLKAKHGLFDNAKGELELFDGIEIDFIERHDGPAVAGDDVPEGKQGGLQASPSPPTRRRARCRPRP